MQKQKFELQPNVSTLEKLAEDYWTDLGEIWRANEIAAFDAGVRIRNGAFTRENLAKIVYWKSPRVMSHIAKNDDELIRAALKLAADADTPPLIAIEKLRELQGVGLPVASAILTAIHPERYTVIDFRALEALGYLPIDANFYMEYLDFCKSLVQQEGVSIQKDYPAPTSLRALDRALWQWSMKNTPSSQSTSLHE